MVLPDVALEVAGRPIEVLALPLIHVGPNDVSVGAVKLGVDIDQGLDVVVAGRHISQAVRWIAQYLAVHDCQASRRQVIDIEAKERRLPAPRSGLVNRLRVWLS